MNVDGDVFTSVIEDDGGWFLRKCDRGHMAIVYLAML